MTATTPALTKPGRHRHALLLLTGLIAFSGSSRADPPTDFGATGADDALAYLVDHYVAGSTNAPSAALMILKDLAGKGNVPALARLGQIDVKGEPDKSKVEQGLAELEKAAAEHSAEAAFILADYYLSADKPNQDYDKAGRFAQQAADAGYPGGFFTLGVMDAYGMGRKQDRDAAAQNMKRAADLGDSHASLDLAKYYHAGFGVPKNDVVAYAWASLAVKRAGKKAEAAAFQDDLALLLLPDQLVQGQHLADTWKQGDDLAARMANEPVTVASLSADQVPVLNAIGPIFPEDRARVKPEDVGVALRRSTSEIVVQPSGERTLTWHAEYEARNEASLQNVGQFPLKFDNAIEELDILDAYTQKADGRKIPVDPSAILTQQASDSQDNLMFDDERRKVVIFPNVEVGDVVSFTARWKKKPLIPGFVGFGTSFDPRDHDADETTTIITPKSMPLFFEVHGLDVSRSIEGDNYVYRVTYSNRRPLVDYQSDFDGEDTMTRIFASNFSDYRQFVAAYQPLVTSKIEVTPQVQALADKLTAGISDRRAQAEALYNWVSRHIRYVGIEFGSGGVEPHSADRILAIGYGDCKDHSVIFASLLKAKGIKSELVLINSGWRMSISVPPRIANFDHMLTYLPEFDLYADTTAAVAPFGTLPFAEYGKPVVHVPLDGVLTDDPVVRRIPVLKTEQATLTMKTTAHLKSDGKIVGDSESIATGPFSVELRQAAIRIQSDNPAQRATKWLKDDGYDGTGSFDFSPPHDLAPSYRLSGHFETDAYDGLFDGSRFELPRGLVHGWSPGTSLMGSIRFKGAKDDPTYCWSGHEVEELSLELPAGMHVTKLPPGTSIENTHMKFFSSWSVNGQTVTVRRVFISSIDEPVCLGWTRTTMARDLLQIKNDLDTEISLSKD